MKLTEEYMNDFEMKPTKGQINAPDQLDFMNTKDALTIKALEAQRDEALAEIERLKADLKNEQDAKQKLWKERGNLLAKITDTNATLKHKESYLFQLEKHIELREIDTTTRQHKIDKLLKKVEQDEALLCWCLEQLEYAQAGSMLRNKLKERLGVK
jgi:septal ring factor EnvC (AmiA/AmiB activator)